MGNCTSAEHILPVGVCQRGIEGEYELEERSKVTSEMSNVGITKELVLAKTEKLKERKSQGPDMINPKLLKECKEILCYPLARIFEKLQKKERLPSDWKLANVTPIHKGGGKTVPSNYRWCL